MKTWSLRTRAFVFTTMVAALLLSALLVSAAPSYAVAHKYPGTPMGPAGASGVVDDVTNPQDVYSVYLFRGQEVGFDCAFPGYGWVRAGLYAPGPFGEYVTGDIHGYFTYIPAVSGAYTLYVMSSGVGQNYTIDVLGAETMPQPTTTTLSGASRVRVKKTLTLSGTVSPAESPGRVTVTKSRLIGRKWKSAGSAAVAVVGGSFTYGFKPAYRGKWRLVAKYRTCTLGTTTYVTSKSGAKTVTVR